MGRRRKNRGKKEQTKPVRVLKVLDKHGRVMSIRIVYSFRDIIEKVAPEYLIEKEPKQGEVCPFPTRSHAEDPD